MFRDIRYTEYLGSGSRYGIIVFHRAAADPDRSDQHTLFIHNRQAARKRDEAFVGYLDPVKRLSRLRQLSDFAGRHHKEDCRLGLLDCNID